MSKSIKALLAAAVVGLFAWGCEKYDDTALNKKIDGLDTRVTALEKAVQDLNNTTIPGLKSLIEALQKQVSISSVTPTADGYVISFSDGTKATLTNGKDGVDGKDGQDGKDGVNGADGKDGKDGANGTDGKDGKDGADGQTPVIGVKLVDGVYCWTVNGELLLDANQKPIPVTGANGKDGKDGKDGVDGKDGKDGADGKDGKDGAGAVAPQFRITDGVWEVSVDGGTTWAAVPVTGSVPEYVIITETEVAYVFTFADESTIVIPKEQVFCLVITPQQETTDIYSGETLKFDYVVKGASAEDELLVDILNITPNYWAFEQSKVVPDEADATKGVIEITSSNWGDGQYKIFIHAANGKGKTDTKVIVVTSKTIDAVFDVALEAAAGGEYAFEVKSNDPFTVVTTVDWITAAKTKANYEWTGTITIAPNETNVYRDGFVRVIYDDWGGVAKEFYVLQEPATDKATAIYNVKYNFADVTEGVKANNLTVIAASKNMAVVIDAENTTSGSHILVLDKLDKEVEAGKVYSFVGKKLAVSKGGYNDVWLTDVTVQDASSEVEPVAYNYQSRYQQMSQYQNRRPTILYGKLQKEGEEFFIVSPLNEKYTFVIDDAAFALDELVGKNVLMPSYKLYYIQDETDPEVYAIHVIATHVQVMELDANPTISYENDKYWTATVTAPENLHYWYWAFDQEKEVTPEDVQSMMDDMVVYNVLSNVGYYTMEDILSWYSFTGERKYSFYNADLANNLAVLAIELGENGFPTGKYLLQNFKREPVPYENYLGYWQTYNGVIKLEQKEAGQTYTARGLFWDWNAELEFKYDEKKGLVIIPSQDMYTPEQREDGYYVQVLDNMNGYWKQNGGVEVEVSYEQVGQDIGSIQLMNNDRFRFTPLNVAEGYEGYWYLALNTFKVETGEFNEVNNWYYVGYGTRTDPSEAYLAWGGSWKLGDSVITITPVENSDREYTITGLHPTLDITLYAYYDMAKGNVDIYGYQNCGKDYTNDGHKYRYYLVGKPAEEGVEWITDDKLASFVKNEDGTYSVVPGTCSYDNETLYAKFGLVGNYTDIWDWEGDDAIVFDLPTTLEKANAPAAAPKKMNKVELKSMQEVEAPAKDARIITLKEFRARLAK